MPISKDEWDAGRTWETLEARILTFLRQNKNKGFNTVEIAHGMGYQTDIKDFWGLLGGIASVWAVREALKKLMKEGTVKAKIIKKDIGEQTYYLAK